VESLDAFLAHYGYFAIFGLLMLGIVGPFIPDDSILILSGIAVHRGRLDLATTIAVAWAGSVCGITLSYALGRTGAVYVLDRWPPVEHWVNRNMPKAEKWFARYGKWTLFFGYFIAGVRHFTALAAGMSKVRVRTFAAYAYPGGLAWATSFIAIGYYIGAEWEKIRHQVNRGALIVAGILAAIGIAVWRLKRRSRAS
jgi:membrane protein DedA with SNARE-associated domain